VMNIEKKEFLAELLFVLNPMIILNRTAIGWQDRLSSTASHTRISFSFVYLPARVLSCDILKT
jgi:hypothetical protein